MSFINDPQCSGKQDIKNRHIRGKITYIPCTNHMWVLPEDNQSDASFIADILKSIQAISPVDNVNVVSGFFVDLNAISYS